MPLRIMASRHSAFYSPLIATIARGFDATYAVLGERQRSQDLIRDGAVDIMQSAVSSNWKPMERGEGPLPVHFALINRRDGFFLAASRPEPDFTWKQLEGRTLLADRGAQPFAMLRYAVHYNGVDWDKIQLLEGGGDIDADFLHRQAPGPGIPVVSVGASMPELAFSTLCCAREFVGTPAFNEFLAAFTETREWVRSAPAAEVAETEASFFPGVAVDDLADAVAAYQAVGTWTGTAEITDALYQQALNVFEFTGDIKSRPPRAAVCV